MKKLLATFGFTIAAALANSAMAGPGDGCHFHGSKPAAESVVIKCAEQRKESLVKGGKLEASWATVKHESISMIDGKKGKEWRISATNKNIQSLIADGKFREDFLYRIKVHSIKTAPLRELADIETLATTLLS